MNILVIGTGTIGEPLIGVLADMRHRLGINELMFHKRTPLSDEVSKVDSLIKRGARLVVSTGTTNAFALLGHPVTYLLDEALMRADAVIDCTPSGNDNKRSLYSRYEGTKKVFIAQGSEHEFGIPYAHGINDDVALTQKHIQIVSCNTHSIACIIKTFASFDIACADFVCVRRSSDLSQRDQAVSSPIVDSHNDAHGTHHARDASELFRTLGIEYTLSSSSLRVPTQYMHVIRFSVDVRRHMTHENALNAITSNRLAALTLKDDAGRVFSFGRDHGRFGRIMNHAVFVQQSLCVLSSHIEGATKRIVGYCFTPQDGNSLLSSIVAATMHNNVRNKDEKLAALYAKTLFTRI